MKKLFLLAIVPIIASCTFTKQQKAEKLVKAYLMERLNDPHSYESVKFGKLDTNFANYLFDPTYKVLEDSLISTGVDISSARENLEYPDLYSVRSSKRKIAKRIRDSISFAKEQSNFIKHFVKKQEGWVIAHTYRAKNGFGALGLHATIFTLNMACDSVINADEVDN